jgi:hypothetical protein
LGIKGLFSEISARLKVVPVLGIAFVFCRGGIFLNLKSPHPLKCNKWVNQLKTNKCGLSISKEYLIAGGQSAMRTLQPVTIVSVAQIGLQLLLFATTLEGP